MKIEMSGATLETEFQDYDNEGREVYGLSLTLPDGTVHTCEGIRSPLCGRSLREEEVLETTLSFLSAAAAAVAYSRHTGKDPFATDENGDLVDPDSSANLFPRAISEWSDSVGSDYLSLEGQILIDGKVA